MFSFFKKKPSESIQVKSTPDVNPDPIISRTKFRVLYSYEWKKDVPFEERDTEGFESRPFCKKLMELDKVYTRVDIESITARLGYSVFDSCGGEGCRHEWVSVTLIEKDSKSK